MKVKYKNIHLNPETKTLLIIFGLNLVLRFIYYLLFFDKHGLSVNLPEKLDEITLLLINGGEHVYPTAWSSYHLVLSLIYLPLKYLNLLEYRLAVTAFTNLIFCSLTAVIIYKITLKLFPKDKYLSYIICGFFTLYYPLYYFSLLSIPESLFTLILTSIFYILISKKFNLKSSLLIGLLLATGFIIKPITLSLILLLMPWIAVKILKEKSQFKHLFITIVTFSLLYILSAGLNYNFDKNKAFIVSGNGGVNFTMAWCKAKRISYNLANGESRWFAPPVFQERSELQELTYNVPFRDQIFYYNEGLKCLKENPERLIANIFYVLHIFHSKLYPDLIYNPIHKSLINLWKLITIPLLIGFFIFPLFNESKRKEWFLGFIFFFSLIGAVYTSNPGEERYLIPYYFILLVFGVWIYKRLISKLLNKLKDDKISKELDL